MAKQKKSGKKPPSGPSGRGGAECDLRIVGGDFRGRKLRYHGDPSTRPMKDRVREAIFNLLGPAIKRKHAIDLFAGTGAIGLEALSRGASEATFLERHFPTARLLEANADGLQCLPRCRVVAADTFLWIQRHVHELPAAAWTVFCCPPYAAYVEREADLVALVKTLFDAAPRESQFVVESDDRFDAALSLPFAEWDIRSYPPAHVALTVKS